LELAFYRCVERGVPKSTRLFDQALTRTRSAPADRRPASQASEIWIGAMSLTGTYTTPECTTAAAADTGRKLIARPAATS
jgi:hypothetical protein